MREAQVAWQPFEEPLRATLTRTVTIAVIGGVMLALLSRGRVRWPIAILLLLWPSLGGHVLEVLFLNVIRPRLPAIPALQVAARLGVWFLGGAALMVGMHATAVLLAGFRNAHRPAWWLGGLAFIGIELVAHLVLQLRGRPSVYNGRG